MVEGCGLNSCDSVQVLGTSGRLKNTVIEPSVSIRCRKFFAVAKQIVDFQEGSRAYH